MKTIASIVVALTFVTAAQAEDVTKSDAAPANTQATEPSAATAAPVQGTVARAAITHAVENHEPIDNVTDVTTDIGKISYFTELRGMEGQTVTHRWQHNGETMAEIPFQVGGSRWRVFSSKKLAPTATGEWQVSVVDAGGRTLHTDTFMYTEAREATASSAATKEMSGAADTKAQTPAKQ
jgi:hypothetical protein